MSAENDDRCRDDEHEQHDCHDAHEGAWQEVHGHGYVRNLTALHDQVLTEQALDAAVPLGGRWPDPRVLRQTDWWWMPDGERLELSRFGPADAAWLLRWLRDLAPRLHGRAAVDEDLTTPSAVLRAMEAAGVHGVEQVEPVAWVDGSPLARRLAALAGR